MKKLIVMLMMSAIFIAVNANAGDDWVTVDQNESAMFKINVDTIVESKENGHYVTFMSVYDFKKVNGVTVDKNMKKYSHLVAEYVINCNSKQFMVMSTSLYNKSKIMSRDGQQNKLHSIENGTFMGTAYEFLCQSQAKADGYK